MDWSVKIGLVLFWNHCTSMSEIAAGTQLCVSIKESTFFLATVLLVSCRLLTSVRFNTLRMLMNYKNLISHSLEGNVIDFSVTILWYKILKLGALFATDKAIQINSDSHPIVLIANIDKFFVASFRPWLLTAVYFFTLINFIHRCLCTSKLLRDGGLLEPMLINCFSSLSFAFVYKYPWYTSKCS